MDRALGRGGGAGQEQADEHCGEGEGPERASHTDIMPRRGRRYAYLFQGVNRMPCSSAFASRSMRAATPSTGVRVPLITAWTSSAMGISTPARSARASTEAV